MLGWFRSKNKENKAQTVVADEGEVAEVLEEALNEADAAQPDPGHREDLRPERESLQDTSDIDKETDAKGSEKPDGHKQETVADPETKIDDIQSVAAVADKDESLFGRLQKKLFRTRQSLVYRLDSLFLGKKEIDQELFDDLEEILITADMGVATSQELLEEVRKEVKRNDLKDPQLLREVLSRKIRSCLVRSDRPAELVMPGSGPFVIMVVGVNGVGKTTSIGKIAAKFSRSGKSVLLVAADTFRAAAVDQLKIWASRCEVDIVAQKQGADPSSVVFDAIEYGTARNVDVILVDTAGRLHTQVNLMEELKKIKRVMSKKLPGAPHEVMLILDSTTGQNGISQAKLFNEAVGVTGLTLTKLDGTAKGGIVVNICSELGVPVRFIGIGEQIDDLRDFDPEQFVDALFLNDATATQEGQQP